jgi:hypothetical protein
MSSTANGHATTFDTSVRIFRHSTMLLLSVNRTVNGVGGLTLYVVPE